jgi:hypothetical protein
MIRSVVFLAALTLALPALAQQQPPARPATAPAQPAARPAAPAAAPARPAAAPVAPPQKLLGEWGKWKGTLDIEDRNPVCFLTAPPTASEPKDARRTGIVLQVYHRPGLKQRDVVTSKFGYAFKDGATAVFEVDGQKVTLFTKDDAAWTYTEKDDRTIVDAMKRGNELVVRGTSARGTATVDRYSLSGFSAGLAEINKACNIR